MVYVFKRILIATDGSKPSEHAARVAIDLAALSGGMVFAVYVVDSGRISDAVDGGIELAKDVTDGARLGLQKEGHMAARFVEELAKASGVPVQTKVHIGYPAETILKSAAENQSDAIVIGSLGRTGLSRILLGSVAEKVVRNSKIPVVVVPGAQN